MDALKPLVVDLDGTLLRSDISIETCLYYIKSAPFQCWRLLSWWLRGGKINLKAQLAQRVEIDSAQLPFDEKILAWLRTEKLSGRRLILATASQQKFAQQIAAHLNLFDHVLATDDHTNLAAANKRDVLVKLFGDKGFDYVGNSADDLPVWQVADRSYVVNPESGVEQRARLLGNVQQVIHTSPPPIRLWVNALRMHQWLKNLLLFIPLFAVHQTLSYPIVVTGILAFIFFGCCASSVYLLNDLLDLQDDRHHPAKKNRPLASGELSLKTALWFVPVLLLVAFVGSLCWLSNNFVMALAVYYLLALSYSLLFKRIMILDIVILTMLYTLRIIAGTAAFNMPPSFWILIFSMFIFTSLALVKRYTELRASKLTGHVERTHGRGYYPSDLEIIAALGATSGYVSVLVLALYVQDPNIARLYHHPQLIWLACPLLLFWVSRVWLLAHRGLMHEDPIIFAIRDRVSLLIAGLLAIIFWAAT